MSFSPGSMRPAGSSSRNCSGGVAVLADEQDVGVGGVAGVVDREHDDRAVVADDVAARGDAAGLFDLIGGDGEDPAFVNDFGGETFALPVRAFAGLTVFVEAAVFLVPSL